MSEMRCVPVAVLPHGSVVEKVRNVRVWPLHVSMLVVSFQVTGCEPLHASSAVALVSGTPSTHETERSGGIDKTGGLVSTMFVTSNTTADGKPHASVAEYERVNAPALPQVVFELLVMVKDTLVGEHASKAVGVCAGGTGVPHSMVREVVRIDTTGGVVSVMVMTCV